jgi:hypothetical protein
MQPFSIAAGIRPVQWVAQSAVALYPLLAGYFSKVTTLLRLFFTSPSNTRVNGNTVLGKKTGSVAAVVEASAWPARHRARNYRFRVCNNAS